MWIGNAIIALQFRRPAMHLSLQRLEGWLMVVLGGVFLTEITLAHHGGMFSATGGCACAARGLQAGAGGCAPVLT
jgi:hypothetical protein